MAVSLWGRYDWMGQKGKWERGGTEACPAESARAGRLRTGYCTQQIWDIGSVKSSPVLCQPHSTLLNTEAIYSVYQNYLWAWEYKRFEIPVNVTKVWFFVFTPFKICLFFFPCKSSNPVILHVGPSFLCAFTVSFCLPMLLLPVKLEHSASAFWNVEK